MQQSDKRLKTVLVISSQVIRGAVGNRVNVYVLENLGYTVWAMPTVIMPWQPRQGVSHKLAVQPDDFAAWAQDIANSPRIEEIDAVITGYFVSPEQVEIATNLIKQIKQKRPDCLFLCDPIMGNENGPYIAKEVREGVKNHLVPLADLVKPNRNELEWICEEEFQNNDEIVAAIKKRFNCPFLVSSAFASSADCFANLYYDGQEVWLAEHAAFSTVLNGFGDIIASLFLYHYMHNESAQDIVQKTSASVYEHLLWTLELDADELALPSAPFDLANPKQNVKITKLA